ncbi:MAG: LysR family transcriptional regulator [Clostridia bacterium]
MPRARITDWERHIGRRLRLRDLFVLFTVVDAGSMAKAAAQLGVSTPSVSALLADLEHALGVRLLDRTPKGVRPTLYGQTILRRGRAAFDELRQGIRDIEFLADPAAGEVRIACPESLAAYLALVIERIVAKHPAFRFNVQVVSRMSSSEFQELLERKADLRLARLTKPPVRGRLGENYEAEVLFDDPFFIVVGRKSRWAHARTVDLAELAREPWIFTPDDALAGLLVAAAFRDKGLEPPKAAIETFSIHLRSMLASTGKYVAVLPRSFLRTSGERYELKALPVHLSHRPSPVAAVTLRNRTLTPAVDVFLQYTREVAKSLGDHAR